MSATSVAAAGTPDKRVAAAIASIEDRFVQFHKPFEDSSAWGEHVDPDSSSDQIGIYGTVAAVEVLGSARYSPDTRLVADALRSLDVHFPSKDHRWFQKRDFDMTLKRAWLARADCPGVARAGSSEDHRKWLLDAQLEASGWGVYTGETDRSTQPEWVSTAFALLALGGHHEFDGTSRCANAVRWLVGFVGSKAKPDAADLALVRMAVRAVKVADDSVRSEVRSFMRDSQRTLEAFARRHRNGAEVSYRIVSHTVGVGAHASATPFNIPRELVVAVDLLEDRNPLGLRLIQPFVEMAQVEHGIRTQDRYRTETQLWAIRAFRLMAGVPPDRLSRTTVVWAIVIAVCIGAMVAAIVTSDDSVVDATATQAAAVAASILASAIVIVVVARNRTHGGGDEG